MPPTPDAEAAREAAKAVTDYNLFTYAGVLALSAWGGIVSFVQKVRAGKVRPFNVVELIGEIAVSGFVGVLTFWLAEAADTPQLLTAAMVGIASHMGTRGLFRMEQFLSKRLGLTSEQEANAEHASQQSGQP